MTPLSDALTAAQKRALAALEKAYVAGMVEPEDVRTKLELCGITDPVERTYLLNALDVIREWGAPVPAEPATNGKADERPSEKQAQLIADLCRRKNVPIPVVGTKADASKVIDELQAGTYDPAKWEVPF